MSAISNEQLAIELAEAKLKIKQMEREKRKVGISFSRIPETGSQIEPIIRGDFPYLQPLDYLSYTHEDRISDYAENSLNRTDGNITLIEGENLAVLSALQLTHKGRVDVIYIDPPYNTGNNDFIYNDARKSSIKDVLDSDGNPVSLDEYETFLDGKARTVSSEDPERHSLWLSFMERRLYLAKELLSDTGVIFVSIDDNEQARLKLLMDAVLGEQNFVSNIAWRRTDGQPNVGSLARVKEYVLVYSKDKVKLNLGRLPLTDRAMKEYQYEDSYGAFRRGMLIDKTRGRYWFDITSPTGRIIKGPWMRKEEEVLALIQQNRVYWPSDGENQQPYRKIYAKDSSGQIPNDFWGIDFGTNQRGSKELENILSHKGFDFPKPSLLIKNILRMATSNPNAIILDFFAGSGTTAHAVAELNSEDGGSRRCILVTHGDENGKNIAEDVTAARVKRVLSGKGWADGKEHSQLPGELTYMKLMFAPKQSNPSSAVELMQSKFSGLVSLEQDATIREYGDYYITLANSKKLVVLLTNQDYLYEDYETVVDFLNNLKDKTDYNEYIVYIPTSETYDEFELQLEDWHKIPYPSDYLRKHSELINYMKGRKLLIPSTTVDSEDEEISEESK